jgi:hypothetical protein
MGREAPVQPASAAEPRAAASTAVLLTLACGQFLMTLDTSVMNASIATVAEDVDTRATGMQTAITLYMLVMASLMVTGGKLVQMPARWPARPDRRPHGIVVRALTPLAALFFAHGIPTQQPRTTPRATGSAMTSQPGPSRTNRRSRRPRRTRPTGVGRARVTAHATQRAGLYLSCATRE